MANERQSLRLGSFRGETVEELRREMQSWAVNLENALDEIRGHRGTPTFYADVDGNGMRFTNIGDPQDANDAQKRGLALSRSSMDDDYDADGLTIRNVRFATEDSEAVPLAQIQNAIEEIFFEPDTAPPKVADASAIGDRTEGFAYGNHTHQGVNRDDAQSVSGEKTFTAAQLFQHHVILDDVTPSQITSNQNDYNPGNASVWRLSTDASRTVTGFAGHSDRERIVVVLNIGSNDLVIAHQSASSSAANRVITATGADVTLTANQSTILWYDPVTDRWRQVVSSSGGGGGGAVGAIQWVTWTSRTSGISAEVLTAGNNALSDEVDNSTNLDTHAICGISVTTTPAPTEDEEIRLYLLYDTGGGYPDGTTSTDPKGQFIDHFLLRAVTTAQIPPPIEFELLPFPFILLLDSQAVADIDSITMTILTGRKEIA